MQNSIEIGANGKPVPYAWPGGYPIYYLIDSEDMRGRNTAVSCHACIPRYLGSDDVVTDSAINWEDAELYCELCNDRIESAYAEEAR